ncbi:MAG: cellulase (glycosyl hydrolase family 5) [Ruminococcus sp.]|nr:cellulase (glycosyl hydrolase family 5) [Ruminococcus sp.]MBR1393969.1 cellulase (glycosyl hydrolase family 5) [Ruminococcus sp.]
MTKRIISLCAAAVMSLAALTACGDSSSSQEDASSKEPQTSSQTEDTSSKEDTPSAAPVWTTDPAVRMTVEGTDLVVAGEKIFLNGMNTPWNNWNDFGGNYSESYWERMFKTMHENGQNAARVWITCNGDVGIDIDDNGFVTGATAKHWQDLDSFFAIAEKHQIYIMATLISFDHFKDTYQSYMKWRAMLQNDDAIDSYVNNYVIPFCERYDGNEYLFSIDLINEPDWVIENEECGQLPWEAMGSYFARAAAAVHEHSDILVTIGMGMIKYNSEKYGKNYASDEYLQSIYQNDKAYVDFWSTHYYTWMKSWLGMPFKTTAEDFGMDLSKPRVIGECEVTGVSNGSDATLEECYQSLYDEGWCGIFPWTTDDIFPGGEVADKVLPVAKPFFEKYGNKR